MNNHYDIAVIGGGASGLFFTAIASGLHKDKKFIVIEKNQRVGKKLLVTGNGRCNLTNVNSSKDNYHGSFAAFIDEIMAICPPKKVLELFLDMGLVTKTDNFQRVYPKSNQASSVLDVLRFNCEKENVHFSCENKVTNIEKDRLFKLSTDNGFFTADKLIIATGGAAAPKSGGDKSGYDLLKTLGHTIIKPSPALCPVCVKSDYLKSLKGIRVQGEVNLFNGENLLRSDEGEIQFTENALSGICVFNLSQYIEKGEKYKIRVKLMPEADFNKVFEILKNNRRLFINHEAENLMTGIFHKRISQSVLKSAKISLNKKVGEITDNELKTISNKINNFDFEVVGKSDFNQAQATKGGVKADEININTMESKKIKGLYIIGEALDCNGDCGGYNLQFAFATGYLAANKL